MYRFFIFITSDHSEESGAFKCSLPERICAVGDVMGDAEFNSNGRGDFDREMVGDFAIDKRFLVLFTKESRGIPVLGLIGEGEREDEVELEL